MSAEAVVMTKEIDKWHHMKEFPWICMWRVLVTDR